MWCFTHKLASTAVLTFSAFPTSILVIYWTRAARTRLRWMDWVIIAYLQWFNLCCFHYPFPVFSASTQSSSAEKNKTKHSILCTFTLISGCLWQPHINLLLWMQKMHTAHTAPSSLFSPSFITFTTDILNNSVSFASLTLTAQVLEMEHPSAERSGKANTLTPSSGKPRRAFLSLLCPAAWIHMSAALLHWQPLYLEDL